ncbi:MAG: type II toxin-antitoxin system VapC family toxin [Candidatus Scalindua sp.]
MNEFVIDTSVVVKWFSKDEDDSETALHLRQDMLDGYCTLIAPDLLIYELANVLKYNPNFTIKDVKVSMDSVYNMGIDIKRVDSLVITHAIEIAFEFNVTIYDACFMALSQIVKKPFLAVDYKFTKRIKGYKDIIRLSAIKCSIAVPVGIGGFLFANFL